jgi:hypothetical protein
MNMLRSLALAIFTGHSVYVFAPEDAKTENTSKKQQGKRDKSEDAQDRARKKQKASSLYDFNSKGALVFNAGLRSEYRSPINRAFGDDLLKEMSSENLPYGLALVLTLEGYASGTDKEIAELINGISAFLPMLSPAQRDAMQAQIRKQSDLFVTSMVCGLSDIDLVLAKTRAAGMDVPENPSLKLFAQYLRNWLRLHSVFGLTELARMHQAEATYFKSTNTKLSVEQAGALEEYTQIQSQCEALSRQYFAEYPGSDVVFRVASRGVVCGFTRQDFAEVVDVIQQSIERSAPDESTKSAAMSSLGIFRRFSAEYLAQLDKISAEVAKHRAQ